ncbi:FxsA family protein [Arhodomonas sp. SL1]|uniref:FxsA family protein n=1 Tax=Arhodomonas sp. SL1 TaxID=3425691 RepID=UPI003F881719
MPLLILLFIGVPLVELYVLIQVGGVIGALPTIALCVLTAVAGGALLRQQGLATLTRARANLERGSVPAIELLEAVALALGGALLLTPGFITDVVGFACLIPWTRHYVIGYIMRNAHITYGPPPGQAGGHRGGQDYIEGEYHRRDDDHRR